MSPVSRARAAVRSGPPGSGPPACPRGLGGPAGIALQAGYSRALEELAHGHGLGRVLATLTAAIEEQADGLLGSVLLLDEDRRHLRHGAAPRLPAAYVAAVDGLAIGPAAGSCGTAAHLNRRVVAEDIAADPRWEGYRELAAKHGLRSCWSQPIVSSAGEVLGTFAMYGREPRRPDACEDCLIETAVHVAGIAIESWQADRALRGHRDELEGQVAERTRHLETANRHLERELAGRTADRERLRALATELALAEETERRRLGTDLHDHVGQTLGLAQIKLQALLDASPPEAIAGTLGECNELLGQAIERSRTLMFELSPPVLYDLGFAAAASWLVDENQGRAGVRFRFADDFSDGRRRKPLAEGLRAILFRAVRELLLNVVKHSGAKRCRLRLCRDGKRLRVTVEDDGAGFDPGSSPAGLGLLSIREQLTRLGGEVEVEPRPGEGTRVVLWGPLEAAESGAVAEL